jgi:hypothetical protein
MLNDREAKLAFEIVAVAGYLTINMLTAGVRNYTPELGTVFKTLVAAGIVERLSMAVAAPTESCCFGKPLHANWFGPRRLVGPVVGFGPVCALTYMAIRSRLISRSIVRSAVSSSSSSVSFPVGRSARFGFGIGIAWIVGDLLKTYLLRRYFRLPRPDSDWFLPAVAVRWIADHVSAPLAVAVWLIAAERWPAVGILSVLPLAAVAHGFFIAACRWLRLTFLPYSSSVSPVNRRPDTPRPTTALFVPSSV